MFGCVGEIACLQERLRRHKAEKSDVAKQRGGSAFRTGLKGPERWTGNYLTDEMQFYLEN
jgi:hypothetical protein